MLHQGQRLAQGLIEIKRRHFRLGLFRECSDAPNDLAGPSAVPDDSLQGGVHFGEIGLFVIEPGLTCLGVDEYGAERLIDLVSDRGGQLAQAGHAHHVRKVGLGFVQLMLRQPDRADIHHRSDELDVACLIAEGSGHDVNVFDPFIGHSQSILVLKIVPVV